MHVDVARHGLRHVLEVAAGAVAGGDGVGRGEQQGVGAVAVVGGGERHAGLDPAGFDEARELGRGGKRHVGRQDQRLGRAAGKREGDAALHRRIELAARLDVGLGHDGGALALGEGRDLPVGRHDQDASYPLDASHGGEDVLEHGKHEPAAGRVRQSRRKPAFGEAESLHRHDRKCRGVPHRAALALPARESRSQKARHWRARATLSSRVRIMVLVTIAGIGRLAASASSAVSMMRPSISPS